MKQKGFTPIFLVVGLVVAIGIMGGAFYFGKLILPFSQFSKPSSTPVSKACTEEAKLCPDGSAVGRTGPNCEFAPCPSLNKTDETTNPDSIGANWKTYQSKELQYEFQYPSDWNETQAEEGSKSFAIQRFQDRKLWSIVVSYISEERLSVMGISYCGAHQEDKVRCESKQISESVRVGIDWGIKVNNQNQAYASIAHPDGGIVTFTLNPVTPETKNIFIQLFSTFKFLDQQSSIPLGPESEVFFDKVSERLKKVGTPSAPMESLY